MMHRHEDREYGFARGLFLGAAMGAIAALLFTPKSGRELRGRLSRSSERLKERAYGVASELRERGESAIRKTRRASESAMEGLEEKVRGLGDGSEEPTSPRPISTT